jgi:hypothetical protein
MRAVIASDSEAIHVDCFALRARNDGHATNQDGETMREKTAAKLTPDEWQARFHAAAKAAQREYCDIFAFWRDCRYGPCRKAQRCSGDAIRCLKRGIGRVPYDAQYQAFGRVIAATPETADSPTKTARRFPPHDFASW